MFTAARAGIALLLLIGCLGACGDDEQAVGETASNGLDTTSASEDAAEEEVPTEGPADDTSTAEEPTAEEPTAEEPTAEEPTAEEPTAEEPTAEAVTGVTDGEFCVVWTDDSLGGPDDIIDDDELSAMQGALDRLAQTAPDELADAVEIQVTGTQRLFDAIAQNDGSIAAAFEQIGADDPELFNEVLRTQAEISTYCGE